MVASAVHLLLCPQVNNRCLKVMLILRVEMWERIINSVLPKIGWRQGEKAGHLGRDELWVKGRRVFRRKAEKGIDVEGKRSPNVRNIWKGIPAPPKPLTLPYSPSCTSRVPDCQVSQGPQPAKQPCPCLPFLGQ